MNKLTLATALLGLTTFASMTNAAEQVRGKVVDHYVTIYETVATTNYVCENVDVPIYSTQPRRGNAAEGALLGMIIGGIAGKAVTGKDKGAAAGAIFGGLVGADKGSHPKSRTVISGYHTERQCDDVVTYVDRPNKIYNYSTIHFSSKGVNYALDFDKYDK